MPDLSRDTTARVERLLAGSVVAAQPVQGGYTPAARWLVTLRDGQRVFAKMGTNEHTIEALRLEAQIYQQLAGSFMPRFIAFQDDASEPLLLLEDLSGGFWPPPWQGPLVEEVRQALDALHESRAPLEPFADLAGHMANEADGWLQVASDPAPFLALGLTDSKWLDHALPRLIDASARTRTDGDEVVHFDVRSDNICRTARGVVLIDWNCACLGNGALDTGFWLPSLHAEGGPAPEEILADRPDIAAYVSGFFAARAGLPAIPEAPRVRHVQLAQLIPALNWAARELALPAPRSSELPFKRL